MFIGTIPTGTTTGNLQTNSADQFVMLVVLKINNSLYTKMYMYMYSAILKSFSFLLGDPDPNTGGVSTTVIAGASVGGIVILVIVAVLLFLLCCLCKKKSHSGNVICNERATSEMIPFCSHSPCL